jgi:solute carrier family 6 GABA transporter-like protein 6/8/11/12/13
MSRGVEEMGGLRWELGACLLFGWLLVYFALWKGVRSSGRVLYLTATLPFLLVIAFLGRSLTLDGAHLGITYLFTPQWYLLADAKVTIPTNKSVLRFPRLDVSDYVFKMKFKEDVVFHKTN